MEKTALRAHRQGFTLIELMIVVAIIGILASIAVPNFLRFQCKSKVSEGKTIIKAIYTAQLAYMAETENVAENFEPLSLDLPSNGPWMVSGKYFTFWLWGINWMNFHQTCVNAWGTNWQYGGMWLCYIDQGHPDNGKIHYMWPPCMF